MRRTAFGDLIVESVSDDLGEALMDAGDDVYAILREDEDETPGNWYFEVMSSDDGEAIASSDSIFPSKDAARQYVSGWVKDIQD